MHLDAFEKNETLPDATQSDVLNHQEVSRINFSSRGLGLENIDLNQINNNSLGMKFLIIRNGLLMP
jgi:hypothetical protein